jgi:hypothetical protein
MTSARPVEGPLGLVHRWARVEHARDRLGAFSWDNVTPGWREGWASPAALWRLAVGGGPPSPHRRATTGARGAQHSPRRPRTPPRTPL